MTKLFANDAEFGHGGECETCGIWVNDVDVWFCDNCQDVCCEHCGVLVDINAVEVQLNEEQGKEDEEEFLCPECALLESVFSDPISP